MAKKTDSFFIRASADYDSTNFVQTTIDLGAFVDALGKSVLRIHNVSVQYGPPPALLNPSANSDNVLAFQLTTQTQTGMVDLTDKSVVSSGSLNVSGGGSSEVVSLSESLDAAPQHWRNGYLIAVENMYLGIDQTAAIGVTTLAVCLECTVETLSEKAAMALALSQQ